jgi:superfamily II DNA or RNA helicase
VFLKQASDTLSPYRLYNIKIELTEENNLGYSSLYKYTAEELQAVKEYIIKNLHKRFIISSQAPFAALILFIRKEDSSLHFCVDYRKLNTISKRDAYSILLIDETLD